MKIKQISPNCKILLVVFFAFFAFIELKAQTADVIKACAPITINFTAPNGFASWYWDFKDGVTSQLENPSHIYSTPGVYNVAFKEAINGTIVGTIIITIIQKADLQIEVLPSEGCVPLSSNFKDLSNYSAQYNVMSKEWIFGDGAYGAGQSTTHKYQKDGIFDIGFGITTDVAGCDVTKLFESKVVVHPLPKVWFSTDPEPPASCLLPFNVKFKDETIGSKPYIYKWDFGNSNIFMGENPPEQIYDTIGTFPVNLSVTDSHGCMSDTTRNVKTGTIDIQLIFPDTVCNGPSPFEITNKSSAGTHSWVFDSDCSLATSNSRSPMIRYYTPGLKTIHYSLKGPNGNCTLDTIIHIFVIDLKNSLTVDFDPNDCALPITFNFNFEGKADLFSWKFGTFKIPEKYGASLLKNPSVTIPEDNNNFSVNGMKSLSVLVMIGSIYGCSLDTSLYISYSVLTAVLKADKYRGCIPFNPKFTDCSFSAQKIVKWIWDFGDGTVITTYDSIPPLHTYDTCGVFIAKLTIENEVGCIDESYPITFKVCGCVPSVDHDGICMPNKLTICRGDSISFNISADPFWKEIRLESDNFRLHHCPDERNFSWVYDHEPGQQNLLFTLISVNGDKLFLGSSLKINVLGAWARGGYMFAGCDKPYTYMFSDSSQNATSIKWIFPDGATSNLKNVSHTFPSNGKHQVLLVAYNDIDGCPPDTTRFNLVTKDFIPKIISEEEYCVGPVTLSVSGDFYTSCKDGIIWKFGDKVYPQNTLQSTTVYFDSAGIYTINVLGHDENGCPYTASKNITIHDIKAKFGPIPDYICMPHNLVLNDNSITITSPIEKYFWLINKKLVSINKNDVVPIDTSGMNSPDSLIVKLIVFSELGCVDTASHLIKFYKPLSGILITDSIFCANEKIEFDAIDYTLQGSYLNYHWDFGNGNSSSINNPDYYYPKDGKYIVKLLYTENSSGCKDSLFQNIYIQKQPDASFTTDVDSISELCYPHIVYFKPNQQEYDTLNYFWDFGNGQTSTLYDVGTTYGKGSYTAKLIVTNEQGCTDTTFTSFLLNGPTGDFTFDKSQVCKGEPLIFTLKDTSEVGSWTWDFGDGIVVTGGNPVSHVYTYLPPGDTTIAKLVLNDSGNNCQVIIEKVVPIINTIADFELPFGLESICPGSLYKLKNLSQNADIYEWTFSNGVTSNLFEPEFKINQIGVFTIKLVATNALAGCTDSITKTIKVGELELPKIPDVTICEGDTTTIGLPTELPDASYTWMPAEGLAEPLKFQTKAYPKTTQTYILNVNQTNGCNATTQMTVIVIPKYMGMLSFEKSVGKGTPVTLTIGSLGTGYKYTWQPNSLLSCSNCSEPIYIADTSTTFTLTLQDSANCGTYLISYKVNVVPDKVDIPNVFTPNGDGKNDFFQVVVPGGDIKGIGVLKFEIYDRWGQKIYANNDTEKGWDGTHKGIPCPSDVYVYVIEVGFFNGDIKKYKGDISLVR